MADPRNRQSNIGITDYLHPYAFETIAIGSAQHPPQINSMSGDADPYRTQDFVLADYLPQTGTSSDPIPSFHTSHHQASHQREPPRLPTSRYHQHHQHHHQTRNFHIPPKPSRVPALNVVPDEPYSPNEHVPERHGIEGTGSDGVTQDFRNTQPRPIPQSRTNVIDLENDQSHDLEPFPSYHEPSPSALDHYSHTIKHPITLTPQAFAVVRSPRFQPTLPASFAPTPRPERSLTWGCKESLLFWGLHEREGQIDRKFAMRRWLEFERENWSPVAFEQILKQVAVGDDLFTSCWEAPDPLPVGRGARMERDLMDVGGWIDEGAVDWYMCSKIRTWAFMKELCT